MRTVSLIVPVAIVTSLLGSLPTLQAQAPGVFIESNRPQTGDAAVLDRARELREAGKLLAIEVVKSQTASPVGGALDLPAAKRLPLPGREVAKLARRSYLQIGWYYLCPRCDHWHLNLSGAYAIAKDAIATCHHCIEPKLEMREGYLLAIDSSGQVLPITGVVARNDVMDAAILRVEGQPLTPLPLSDQIAPGDPAFCFSEPLGQEGYFSAGVVNRFFWRSNKRSDTDAIERVKHLRMNVSTDWAPGSSGAAILDVAGNAIGHVSTISPMGEQGKAPLQKKTKDGTDVDGAPRDRFNGATLITLHEAVPARAIIALARTAQLSGAGEQLANAAPDPADQVAKTIAEFTPRTAAAISQSKWDEAARLIDEMEALLPETGKAAASGVRSHLAIRSGNGAMANTLAYKLAVDPYLTWEVANGIAWGLVIRSDLNGLDLAAVEKLARRGVELASGQQRPAVMDTLARILFRAGRTYEAIEIQESALAEAETVDLKRVLRKTLEAYQDGKLPPDP